MRAASRLRDRGSPALRAGAEVVAPTRELGTIAQSDVGDESHRRVRIVEQVDQKGSDPIGARGRERRLPSEAPGCERSLPGVAAERREHRCGHSAVLGRQRGLRDAIPGLEGLGGPCERAVEMTLIAGIRAPELEGLRSARARHLMAAVRLLDPVDRVRHVAVVATAPARTRRVVRVRSESFGRCETAVALRARGVALHPEPELIIGPVRWSARVSGLLVHCVAGNAGDLAALEARRLEQPAELAPRDANLPIAPEQRSPVAGILLESREQRAHTRLLALRMRGIAQRPADQRRMLRELIARTIGRDRCIVEADRVALTADLRGARMGQLARVHDRAIAVRFEVQAVAPARIPVRCDVLLPRPVTGLASDPELRDTCREAPRPALPALEPGIRMRRVAAAAVGVPLRRFRRKRARRLRLQKGHLGRDPAAEAPAPVEGQLQQVAAAAGRRVPVHLVVMRAGREHDRMPRAPLHRTQLDPQRIAVAPEAIRVAVQLQVDTVEVPERSLRGRDLRHRAVVRGVPRRVGPRVTAVTGRRADVAVRRLLERPVVGARRRVCGGPSGCECRREPADCDREAQRALGHESEVYAAAPRRGLPRPLRCARA